MGLGVGALVDRYGYTVAMLFFAGMDVVGLGLGVVLVCVDWFARGRGLCQVAGKGKKEEAIN